MSAQQVYLVWYYKGVEGDEFSKTLVDVFKRDFDAFDCGWNYVRDHKQENPNGWYEYESREVK